MDKEITISNLHEELAKKKGFVVFAGTGVVYGTGVPESWDKLLEELGQEAGVDVTAEIKRGADYPDIAEDIYNKLPQASREETYNRLLKNRLRPTILSYAPLAREIIKTTQWVVTTNFDETIEKAFDEMKCSPVAIWTLPCFKHENRLGQYTLVYLHGNTETRCTIFKRSDYNLYYPSVSGGNGPRDLENYLEWLYDKQTIVFVGFSFQDAYLMGCLPKIRERLFLKEEDLRKRQYGYKPPTYGRSHYALLMRPRREQCKSEDDYRRKCESNRELESDLASLDVRVVWMDQYRDWIDCFDRVRGMQPVKPMLGNKDGEPV